MNKTKLKKYIGKKVAVHCRKGETNGSKNG